MTREEELGYHLFEEPEEVIAQWNLDPALVTMAAYTTDLNSKIQLSALLLDLVKKRQTMRRAGQTHLRKCSDLAPESAIKSMAVTMLGACTAPPPPELTRLIAALLGMEGRKNTAMRSKFQWRLALRYLVENPDASDRQVAKVAGVAPNTVGKWRSDPQFSGLVAELRARIREGVVHTWVGYPDWEKRVRNT